jgi:hypothetical protein
MKKLRELILRFGGLFNRQRKDRELDDEIVASLPSSTRKRQLNHKDLKELKEKQDVRRKSTGTKMVRAVSL